MTRALFGDDVASVHAPWRKLVSTESFRRRDGLTPPERTALTYERLRLVNDELADPEDLARDPAALAALHEWTGVVDSGLTTVAGIHYNLFLGSVLDHDPERARDLGAFTSMRRLGTFLCTEVDHGNDAAALETTATRRDDGTFVLHTPSAGAQKFMPNTGAAGGPKTAVVAARLIAGSTDHGVLLFLTPLTGPGGPLPGVRIRPLPARAGAPVDHCLTAFDQVVLGPDALLAAHAGFTADGAFHSTVGSRRKRFLRSIGRVVSGKLCMSAAALGTTRTALTVAVRHGHLRHIGGGRKGERVPLFAHRSHAAPLTQALAQVYAMTAWHRETVAAWSALVRSGVAGADGAPGAEAVEREIAVAKGWITWRSRDLTIEARERCGAQGLLEVNGISERAVDIEGTITAEGDNLVVWAKAAGEMLFGHTPPALPPAAPRDRELTDPGFLAELLTAAEHLWHERARIALRQGPSGDPLGRWNAASAPALRLVDAYGARRAAEALRTAAGRAETPDGGRLLTALHGLFALRQVAAAAGDLLAGARLTAGQVRDLPAAIDALTAELADRAQELADAFDVPREWLADVPIAGPDLAAAYDDPHGAWHRPAPVPA